MIDQTRGLWLVAWFTKPKSTTMEPTITSSALTCRRYIASSTIYSMDFDADATTPSCPNNRPSSAGFRFASSAAGTWSSIEMVVLVVVVISGKL